MTKNIATKPTSRLGFVLFYTTLGTITGMTCNAVLLLSYYLRLLGAQVEDPIRYGPANAKVQLGMTLSEFKTAQQQLLTLKLIDKQSEGIGKCPRVQINLNRIVQLANLDALIDGTPINVDTVSNALLVGLKSSKMSPVIRFFPHLVIEFGLSIPATLCLNQILFRSNLKKQVMYSKSRLAKELCCGTSKVHNGLELLKAKELIEVSHIGPGNHYVYKLAPKGQEIKTLTTRTITSTNGNTTSSTNVKKTSQKKTQRKITHNSPKNHTRPVQNSHPNKGLKKKKISENQDKTLITDYQDTKRYSAKQMLTLIKNEQWRAQYIGHLDSSEYERFARHLKPISMMSISPTEKRENWLKLYEQSKQYNRSLQKPVKA